MTSQTISFVAVRQNECGHDYSNDLRYEGELTLDFNPTNRTSTSKLKAIEQFVARTVGSDSLYVLLLSAGEPNLFLSGVLAGRTGQLTKPEAHRLGQQLALELACDQETIDCEFVAKVVVNELEDFHGVDENAESEELMDEVLSEFDYRELTDSFIDEDDALNIDACGWCKVTIKLPVIPSADSPVEDLRYVESLLVEHVEQMLNGGCVIQTDLWLRQSDGEFFFLSGSVRLKQMEQHYFREHDMGLQSMPIALAQETLVLVE